MMALRRYGNHCSRLADTWLPRLSARIDALEAAG